METFSLIPLLFISLFAGVNMSMAPTLMAPVLMDEMSFEEPVEWEDAELEVWDEPEVVEPDFEVTPETGIDYRPLAQCMTDKGWKMYGADWCPHCLNQKAVFGSAFESVTYIECEQHPDVCQRVGIQGYPTWRHRGENHAGTKTVWELAELSGCSI